MLLLFVLLFIRSECPSRPPSTLLLLEGALSALFISNRCAAASTAAFDRIRFLSGVDEGNVVEAFAFAVVSFADACDETVDCELDDVVESDELKLETTTQLEVVASEDNDAGLGDERDAEPSSPVDVRCMRFFSAHQTSPRARAK